MYKRLLCMYSTHLVNIQSIWKIGSTPFECKIINSVFELRILLGMHHSWNDVYYFEPLKIESGIIPLATFSFMIIPGRIWNGPEASVKVRRSYPGIILVLEHSYAHWMPSVSHMTIYTSPDGCTVYLPFYFQVLVSSSKIYSFNSVWMKGHSTLDCAFTKG